MEADSINLTFKNDVIHKMQLRKNTFLTSIDTVGQFNQIRGRNMIGYFDELGNIASMDVNGNGESHYFVMEGDSLFVGMNKMFCSSMKLIFEKNQLQNITFYKNPEAKFIPPHELTDEQIFLDDFDWRGDERPLLHQVATYYKASDGPQYQQPEIPVIESDNSPKNKKEFMEGLNEKIKRGDVKNMRQPGQSE